MKILLTLTALFFVSASIAQQQQIYFLKNNGSLVKTRAKADFIRIVSAPDSGQVLFNVCEFYPDGKPKLIGKSIGNNPLNLEGECVVFYSNGVKQAVVNYKNAQKSGTKTVYYPNGKLYKVLTYLPPLTGDEIANPDNGPLNDGVPSNFLTTYNYSMAGNVTIRNGNGYYKGYNSSFNFIDEEGSVKNGKKEGIWKGWEKTVNARFIEHYKNGLLITGEAVNNKGEKATYTKSRMTYPAFKGGVNAFHKYISADKDVISFAKQHDIHGTIIVDFIVEPNGLLSNIKIRKQLHPVLDHEAIKLMQKSPKWLPGKIVGFPFRMHYSVPVIFPFADN